MFEKEILELISHFFYALMLWCGGYVSAEKLQTRYV
jgi:hypothetical protein